MRVSTRMVRGGVGLALAAATIGGITACGPVGQDAATAARSVSADADAKAAFLAACDKTLAGKDATTTVKVQATKENLTDFLRAVEQVSGPQGGKPGDMSQQQVRDLVTRLVPGLTLTSRVHSAGGPLDTEADPATLDAATTITVGGAAIEVMRTGGDLYVRGDVKALGDVTGLYGAKDLAMVEGTMPPEVSWLGDLASGRWVGVPADVIDTAPGAQGLEQVEDPAALREAQTQLKGVLGKDATVESTGADAYVVRVKMSALLDQVTSDKTSAKDLADTRRMLKDDAALEVRATVKDGVVSHAEMPLRQVWDWWDQSRMSEKDVANLATLKGSGDAGTIVVDLARTVTPITRPANATMVTADQLKAMSKGAGRP